MAIDLEVASELAGTLTPQRGTVKRVVHQKSARFVYVELDGLPDALVVMSVRRDDTIVVGDYVERTNLKYASKVSRD